MKNKLFNLLDFLFPKSCYGCGRWGDYLCSDCLNKIKLNRERFCPVCGKGAIGGKTHPFCQKRSSLDGLTSIFVYKGLMQKITKRLKYKFVFDLGQTLVELLLSSLGEDETFAWFCRRKPILAPVPLHPARERWRGFNQAVLLGRPIAENSGLKFIPDLLIRIKNTSTQSVLNKKQRQKNIKNAFKLNEQFIHETMKQSGFILFDDIWTTGATLNECAKVLKQNGAKSVWGLTLAS